MALPLRRTVRPALTASASRLGRSDQSAYGQRLAMPWQSRALSYYDQIGEVRFASQFYAKLMSRVRFFPAILEDDGSLTPIESGPPVELLNRIQDPGGGRSQIQYDYGRLMFVTGEGVLFGSNLNAEEERWKFLWRDEVQSLGNGTYVRLSIDRQQTNEVGIAYRFWTPHPRHSDEADSPLRPVWEICEELIVLTSSVMGTATTRKTNGMMVVPQELSPGAAEPIGDEDAENNIFLADYAEHLQAQIENPGSAESKVPFLLEGSYEFLDGVRWIAMHDPATDYMEEKMRVEAIKRLGLSLDFNPEFLLGMTDANHWTALQVMHDQWRTHGVGVAKRFGNDLNQAYLRPALAEAGYAQWRNVAIGMDDSQVVISPDRTSDALKAHADGIINGKAAREALGWTEDNKMDGDELDQWLAIKMREPTLLPGESGLQLPQRGPTPSSNGNSDAAAGPAEPTAGRTGTRKEAMTASSEIIGASKMALRRCREVAGARLRSHQHDCPECKEATDGKPNALVASLLGPEQVVKLGIKDPMKLVQGGGDGLRDMLIDGGCDALQARSLAQMLEVYAAKTLFDQRPSLPPGFVAAVEKAQEVSLGAVEHL